jgi:hypothetical protein
LNTCKAMSLASGAAGFAVSGTTEACPSHLVDVQTYGTDPSNTPGAEPFEVVVFASSAGG